MTFTAAYIALLVLFYGGVVICQISINNQYQWPTPRGSSQSNGLTPFTGPNTGSHIMTNRIDTNYEVYLFPSTGLLIGPNNMLVTAFYTMYEGMNANWYYTLHVMATSTTGGILWDYQFSDALFALKAPYMALSNDLICASGEVYASDSGSLFNGIACLNLDGQLQWAALPSIATTTAPFTCQGASLVCSQRTCYSLNSASGALNWNVTFADLQYESLIPVSSDGAAFYRTAPTALTAISCSGKVLWEYPLGNVVEVQSIVTSDDGNVYFRAILPGNGTQYFALDAAGVELWSTEPVGIESAPAVGSGLVVAASSYGIVAFSQSTGETLWQVAKSGSMQLAVFLPVIDVTGRVYITEYTSAAFTMPPFESYLTIYTPGGAILWNSSVFSADGNEAVVSSPVVSSYGSIYAITQQCASSNYYETYPLYFRRFAAALDCAMGYYDPQEDGKGCTKCRYPTSNFESGQYDCPHVWLRFSFPLVCAILSALALPVLASILTSERKIVVCMVIAGPSLDLLTDLAYIMTNKFYDEKLFVLAVVFVLLTACMFAVDLLRSPRYPACGLAYPALGLSSLNRGFAVVASWGGGLGSFLQQRMVPLLPPEPNTLDAFLLHGLARILWCLGYVLSAIFYGILLGLLVILVLCEVLVLRAPLVFLWFLLGAVLHATKSLCIRRVFLFWVRGWSLDPTLDDPGDSDFDTAAYNESTFMEFLLEAFPQLVLQAVNNTMIGAWSEVAIVSAVVSAYMALDTVYKLGYARMIKGQKFEEIQVKPPILSCFFQGTELAPGTLSATSGGVGPVSDAKTPLLFGLFRSWERDQNRYEYVSTPVKYSQV